MAPRNTRNGATATARRAASSGARATSPSRTHRKPVSPKPRTAAAKAAKASACDAPGNGWWIAPAAVALIIAVFVFTYYPVARVQYRETRDLARLEAEYASLEARNVRLRKEVARLRTPEGVEDYARTQLGLVKEGESVAVVTGLPESYDSTTGPATPRIDSDYTSHAETDQWGAFLDMVFQVQ